MQAIDAQTLATKLSAQTVIIDVREPDEFAAGHIPGATNVPLSEITSRLKEIPNDAYVVCQSGARSAMATQYLASQGIRVINVTGGMLAWPAALEV
ncbi:rhodanese-like domain-containing protein [Lacticaseibacillus jixiensis]|uniref:rhodanese-like domain-containing protein n=1 Tax=Lacticaseibacillus jixiensis TaxID=3231926 RepID=UPI0036F2EDCF